MLLLHQLLLLKPKYRARLYSKQHLYPYAFDSRPNHGMSHKRSADTVSKGRLKFQTAFAFADGVWFKKPCLSIKLADINLGFLPTRE